MIQFFSGIEVVPTGVYMALNANGGPSGDAYVQFSRQCDAIPPAFRLCWRPAKARPSQPKFVGAGARTAMQR